MTAAIVGLGLVCGLARLGSAQDTLTKDEAVQLLQQAPKYRKAGEYDKALPLFERESVREGPSNIGASVFCESHLAVSKILAAVVAARNAGSKRQRMNGLWPI